MLILCLAVIPYAFAQNQTNDPPVISSYQFALYENSRSVGTVVASDPDSQDGITGYEVLSSADGSFFTFNSTGGLSFINAPDYENPEGSSGIIYILKVRVTSGTGTRVMTAEKDLVVILLDVDEKPSAPEPPVLVFPSDTTLVIRWSEPANLGPPIHDYDIEYKPNSENSFINWPHTGTATSATIPNLNVTTVYDVRVRANNSFGIGEWSDVSSAMSGENYAPRITNVDMSLEAAENFAFSEQITATDDNTRDSITAYVLEGEDASSFSISNSGVLSLGITPDYEFPRDSDFDSVYMVTVRVYSGDSSRNLSGTRDFNVTVTDVQESERILVSTIGQGVKASVWIKDDDYAAPINTGNVSEGYVINSVAFRLAEAFANASDIEVSLWSSFYDSGFYKPNISLFKFSNPSTIPVGMVRFTAPSSVVLDGNETYDIVVRSVSGVNAIRIYGTSSPTSRVDESSAEGWSLENLLYRPGDSTGPWTGNDVSFSYDFLMFNVVGYDTNEPVVPNDIPAFSSNPAFSVQENTVSVGTVSASDSDSQDRVTGYSVSGGTDASLFDVINSGALSFKSAPDFEVPSDADGVYVVEVTATSGTGTRVRSASQLITVTVTDVDEPPSTPDAPSLSSPTTTSVLVSWSAPVNSGPAVTDYDVEYGESSNGPFMNWSHVGAGTTATITGLSEATTYYVHVRATNDEGTGDWSSTGNVATGTTPNDPPSFSSSTSFTVQENIVSVGTVTAVDTDSQDDVTGYRISGGADSSRFNITETGGLSFISAPDFDVPADADRDNEYMVNVEAASGYGRRELHATQTIMVDVTNVAEPPSAPNAPALSVPSPTSITVSWSAPANSGPAITGYEVQYKNNSAGSYTNWPHTGTATTATITGLSQDTLYFVQVRAANSDDHGSWSVESNITTTDSPNNPPAFSGSSAFSVQENEVNVGTVSASDPDSEDSDIQYLVSGGKDMARFLITPAGELSFVSVPNFEAPADADSNNEYVVEIEAVSGSNPRTLSAKRTITVRVTNANELPSAPSVPTLSFSTSTAILVSWSEPSNTGPVITDYDVQYRQSTEVSFTDWMHDSNSITAEITNLSENAVYYVRVRATSAEGIGNWSQAVSMPTVSNVDVSDVVPTGAYLSVTLVNAGSVGRKAYLRYRVSGSAGWIETLKKITSTDVAVFRLNGLNPDTAYEVQASLDDDFPEDFYQSKLFNTPVLPDGFLLISPFEEGNFSGRLVFNASYNSTPGIKLLEFGYGNSSSGITWRNGTNDSGIYWDAVFDTSTLVDGYYNVSVRTTDQIDVVEVSDDLVTILVDNSAPVFSLVSPSAGDVNGSVLFNASATDDGSGVEFVEFGLSGGSGVTWFDGFEMQQGYWSAMFDTTVLSDGSYSLRVRVTDFAGNENVNSVLTVVVDNVPGSSVVVSKKGSSGGSSGGGGGGSSRDTVDRADNSSSADDSGVVSDSKSVYQVSAGSSANFVFTNPDLPVSSVSFMVSEDVRNARVGVSSQSERPSGVSDVDGTVYRYVTINKSNVADSSVSNVTIGFSVDGDFVSDNGASEDDVVLLRYEGGEWVEVETRLSSSAGGSYSYEAVSDGFGSYAVVLKSAPATGEVSNSVVGEDDDANVGSPEILADTIDTEIPTSGGGSIWILWIVVGFVLVLAAGAGALFFFRKDLLMDMLANIGGGDASESQVESHAEPDPEPAVETGSRRHVRRHAKRHARTDAGQAGGEDANTKTDSQTDGSK